MGALRVPQHYATRWNEVPDGPQKLVYWETVILLYALCDEVLARIWEKFSSEKKIQCQQARAVDVLGIERGQVGFRRIGIIESLRISVHSLNLRLSAAKLPPAGLFIARGR